ncbi:MAG: hypothetical protein IPI67_09575 [Myxococcales bacterium]|nr:hypothetical protein [Myxococcales bacterium]
MEPRIKKRLALALGAVAVGVSALWLWPSSRSQAGYPFARRVAGASVSPLWKLSPEALDQLTADDAERLEHFATQLDRALTEARAIEPLLAMESADQLKAEDRKKVRELWWSFFEPMLALDGLKHRYEGWFGVDYVVHPELHARSFALTYAALCVQVDGGQALLDRIGKKSIALKLFDEAMPALGLPSGTFSAMRARLGRARDYSFVPFGAEWYAQWIDKHLAGKAGERLRGLVGARSKLALARIVDAKAAARTAENKAEVLKSTAFQAWFPLQKEFAEWAGDTRFAPESRRLINDAQLAAMKAKLAPGDILLERRNWYLSNVGLPGFWPHAAIFSGSQAEISAGFDSDPEVQKRYGGAFSQHLAKKYPAAWAALGEKDDAGHLHTVVEAVSEGVVAQSFEHSCGADYVAALRPKLPRVEIAAAIERTLGYFGRPYDFDFNFATDDRVVCSELVLKAYEAPAGGVGLAAPWVTIVGQRAVTPTEFVRLFVSERGKPDAQLEFVYFLEGREKDKAAVSADADALARTPERPKWDVAQP